MNFSTAFKFIEMHLYMKVIRGFKGPCDEFVFRKYFNRLNLHFVFPHSFQKPIWILHCVQTTTDVTYKVVKWTLHSGCQKVQRKTYHDVWVIWTENLNPIHISLLI